MTTGQKDPQMQQSSPKLLGGSGREEGVNREADDGVDRTAVSEIDLKRELTQEVGAQDGV